MWKKIAGAACAAAVAFGATGVGSAQADPYWQCVTFARMFSGIQIFGDAWTWWKQATDKYSTGFTPETGAVLVFQPYGKMSRGHVAVVSQVLTDRIVQVTHANWGGSRGKVEENVTMVDVSEKGDWSKVKVWYDPTGDLGSTVYPTYGFIYKSAQDAAAKMVAQVTAQEPAKAAAPAKDGKLFVPAKDAREAKGRAVSRRGEGRQGRQGARLPQEDQGRQARRRGQGRQGGQIRGRGQGRQGRQGRQAGRGDQGHQGRQGRCDG